VAQVGEAITQMDRVTQQNAALVEESAAAAESLKTQAQQLVQTVAVFKLAQVNVTQRATLNAASAPVFAAAHAQSDIERRGPNRAKNVTRPNFKAPADVKPEVPTLTVEASSRKVGTDDEWTSF